MLRLGSQCSGRFVHLCYLGPCLIEAFDEREDELVVTKRSCRQRSSFSHTEERPVSTIKK